MFPLINIDLFRVFGENACCFRISRRREKDAGDSLGIIDPEIQQAKSEYAPLLDLSVLRLRARIFRLRFWTLHGGGEYLQVQGTVGSETCPASLALLASPRWRDAGYHPAKPEVQVGSRVMGETSRDGYPGPWAAYHKEYPLTSFS